MPRKFTIRADWDDEAKVWVATSEEVLGLATEADTIPALIEKLGRILPELLVENGQLDATDGLPDVPFCVMHEHVARVSAYRRLSLATSAQIQSFPKSAVIPTFGAIYGFSGNSPGIQRDARAAGNARRSGARVLSEARTLRSRSAATIRLALRSLVAKIDGVSPRGTSPR